MSKVNNTLLIAPSLLSADPLNFRAEIQSVEAAGADWHHVDVMDGHFVPNLTYGIPFVKALKKEAKLPLDVHIMVSNPDEVAAAYLDAGADILVFHVEAARHPHRIIQEIHSKGRKAGVALNPGTSLEVCAAVLPFADVVMLMSVNPGFGGQSFIPQTIERIRGLSQMLTSLGRRDQVLIEVDGGISSDNCKTVIAAGANVLVAGTAVYGQKDRAQAVKSLRG